MSVCIVAVTFHDEAVRDLEASFIAGILLTNLPGLARTEMHCAFAMRAARYRVGGDARCELLIAVPLKIDSVETV